MRLGGLPPENRRTVCVGLIPKVAPDQIAAAVELGFRNDAQFRVLKIIVRIILVRGYVNRIVIVTQAR